jgi:WD40 repeat protein
LFADGYWLGSLRFGLPWMLRCARSPDGQRMAFNTGSDGTAPPDDLLRWFNLSEPQALYQPLPLLHAASFAFSPDSRRLAVGGEGESGQPSGAYLINLGTGEASLLLEAEGARSLAWSPDGEYLGLIATLPGEDAPSAIVIYLRSGQIVHQGPLEQPGDLAPLDSPILLWGIPFPAEMGNMDTCAAP